jgi:hypothetical protein
MQHLLGAMRSTIRRNWRGGGNHHRHAVGTIARVAPSSKTSIDPVQYVVGSSKGQLTRLEQDLLAKPSREARRAVQVKLSLQDCELYVFAESRIGSPR